MKLLVTGLLTLVLAAPVWAAGTIRRQVPTARANGIGVNLPVVGRLIGSGILFSTVVDVSNNTPAGTQVDFYFDGVDLATQEPIIIDGSITNAGLAAVETGTVRGYSNVHFDDFINALVDAGRLPAQTRDNGVLGSVLLVFNNFTRAGQGSASARFENAFGGGTVSGAVGGRTLTSNEPQQLVATVRDTVGRSGPQVYTNIFINNMGVTPVPGGAAGAVTVELTARSSSTGQPIGTPITLSDIRPGHTRSVGQVLRSMNVPPSQEDTLLVYARVTSGNAAIAGVAVTLDNTSRDGAIVEMSRADF